MNVIETIWRRWKKDIRFRVNMCLYGTFIWNVAYAVLQLYLGLYHSSFWYGSMALYHAILAIMRFSLARYTSVYKPGDRIYTELKKYRTCGIVFFIMNVALSLMIFFMVYWNKTFYHHEITTIAMATYTFTTFAMAVVNIIKYRKLGSPVFSASKAISLAAGCVSMLTLETTMLTTFGEETMTIHTRRVFLGVSGGVVSAFIIAMAIYMIVRANKALKSQRAIRDRRR